MAIEGKEKKFFVKDYVSSLQYARVNEMPIQTFASVPNYYAIVLAKIGVSASVQFEIFAVKVGSTCGNETDLDEKRIFHYKLLKKLSEAHRIISILKIPLYDTNS